MKIIIRSFLFALFLIVVPAVFGQDNQKFFEAGNFQLDNGQTIRDCKIGYRTLGTLNRTRTNVILFPTYFGGTSKDLIEIIPKIVDTTKYFVIAVDAFGNGVSSSPSTSKTQAGQAFPQFSIRDLVTAEHRLLKQELGLTHIYAVMGISMGGMQAFEWATTFPEFVDKIIPIVGTPLQTAYDLLLWQTELRIIDAGRGGSSENQNLNQAMRTVADLETLLLTTPQNVVAQVKPENFGQFIANTEKRGLELDPNDFACQLKTLIGHDITKPFGKDAKKAAGAVKAKMLIIIAKQDHIVNPAPSLEFAKTIKADVVELTGDCGHLAFLCETGKIKLAVTAFLAR